LIKVRDLPESHFLKGEQGLFAIKKFEQYDVLGEYTGRVVGSEVLQVINMLDKMFCIISSN